jgi:hypothetical protein
MNAYDIDLTSKQREERVLKTWQPLLESTDTTLRGFKNTKQAVQTAVLLENQYRHMAQNPDTYGALPTLNQVIGESLNTQGTFHAYGNGDAAFGATLNQPVNGQYGNTVSPTNNDFYARGDARLPNVVMPMIRRTFPELLANEIVGVQPMSSPVGMAFALRFQYDSESLADFSPDGGNTANSAPPAYRTASNGVEASHNHLNTAFTGTLNADLDGIEAGVSQANGVDTDTADFAYPAQDQGVARLLADVELTTDIPQMSLTIEKTAVEAGSRKLAVKFSLELEQDLQNMHSISVDDEMTNMMSYELQAEIDRELLMRIIKSTLSAGPERGYTIWNPANADGRWSAERSVNLWQAIRVQSRLVGLRNRRGAANFAVVTPYVAAILETLPNFKAFEIDANVEQVFGNSRAGTLGALKVFVDTRSESQYQSAIRDTRVDYILLGYKGADTGDCGLVYLPYIPVQVQRTMAANDFGQRIGLSTRYAIAANLNGSSNYYHMIIMKGLTDGIDGTETKQFAW